MTRPIPPYCMKAYAVLYARHGTRENFRQTDIGWHMSESMLKKTFAELIRSEWLVKAGRSEYRCVSPHDAVVGLLEMRVPDSLEAAGLPYSLTGVSAMEVWSDYSYVQRGYAMSPYFVKVLRKDIARWKTYFNREKVPCYVGTGITNGEFVLLVPVTRLERVRRGGLWVDDYGTTLEWAKRSEVNAPAVEYMENHGATA